MDPTSSHRFLGISCALLLPHSRPTNDRFLMRKKVFQFSHRGSSNFAHFFALLCLWPRTRTSPITANSSRILYAKQSRTVLALKRFERQTQFCTTSTVKHRTWHTLFESSQPFSRQHVRCFDANLECTKLQQSKLQAVFAFVYVCSDFAPHYC